MSQREAISPSTGMLLCFLFKGGLKIALLAISQSSYFARPMNSISGFEDCKWVMGDIL